jgi:hypothetical protein
MGTSTWTTVDWLILVVPVLIGMLAVKIGSAQVREFHDRTGDSGFLISLTALHRYPHDAEESAPTSQPKVPHHI